MDRNLIERMIGAGVLVLLLVLLAPTLLDGSRDEETDPATVTLPEPVLRTETIYLNGTEPLPTVPDQVAPTVQPDKPPPGDRRPVPTEPVQQPSPVVASTTMPAADANDLSKAAGSQWSVQLGSFSNQDNAARLVTGLIDQGYPAYISAISGDGRTMYRVRVGPRPSRDSAAELARTLAAAGHAGMVIAMTDEQRE